MKQKRPQAVKPAVFVSVGAKPRRRITRLALMLKQTKSLILCGIWRFFILIFTGRKGNINGSKKRQKHKKSRQKDFHRIERTLENTGFSRVPLAERMGFEPMCDCSQTDFECCKTLADSPPEQVVSGRFVRSRRPRRCKGFRTFRPVSAGGDLKCPRVQIKLRSCVKSRRSCAFARSQARKQRPRQHR